MNGLRTAPAHSRKIALHVVTQTADPANMGAPVTFTADSANGFIEFNFAGFIFTGTGLVLIVNG